MLCVCDFVIFFPCSFCWLPPTPPHPHLFVTSAIEELGVGFGVEEVYWNNFVSAQVLAGCHTVNRWKFCNKTTMCGSAEPWTGLLCVQFGLLSSRSRTQSRFKVPVGVCYHTSSESLNSATKHGMLVPHLQMECHPQKMGCFLQSQGQIVLIKRKWLSYTKPNHPKLCLLLHHYHPALLMKCGLLSVTWRSQV